MNALSFFTAFKLLRERHTVKCTSRFSCSHGRHSLEAALRSDRAHAEVRPGGALRGAGPRRQRHPRAVRARGRPRGAATPALLRCSAPRVPFFEPQSFRRFSFYFKLPFPLAVLQYSAPRVLFFEPQGFRWFSFSFKYLGVPRSLFSRQCKALLWNNAMMKALASSPCTTCKLRNPL